MPHLTLENIKFYLIIAVFAFLILQWLFKKIIKNDRYRIVTTSIVTLLLTPLIYSAVVAIFFSFLFYEPSHQFNKNIWKNDRDKRFEMADDLIKSKILIGKDSNQIKELLGDTKEKYQDSTHQVKWTYDMGEGNGGLGFLFHSLELTFRENKVLLVRHFQVRN